MIELVVVWNANFSRLLRCIYRNLALPSQGKRGQKRRASANGDSNRPSDEVAAVPKLGHDYSQRSHELSHSVLASIRSAVENDASDDADDGEVQAHDRTAEPVCLVRQSVRNWFKRTSVFQTALDTTMHGLRCNGTGNIMSDASHPRRRHS
eukprot:COSAG02_NODE_6368_length_3621_cov_1.933844_2_plen_151_part_00